MNSYLDLIWRPARTEDAAQIAAILNETIECGGHTGLLNRFSADSMADELRKGRRHGWPLYVMAVPESEPSGGREVAGWLRLGPMVWGQGAAAHGVSDMSLYVRADWQCTGLARRMMLLGLSMAASNGFHTLTGSIVGSNHRSRSLARAMGFELWGKLPRIVHFGGREDDLEIWGVKVFDEAFLDRLEQLQRIHERRVSRQQRKAREASSPETASST